MKIQTLLESKKEIFERLAAISTQIAENLVKAEAFTEDDNFGKHFAYGKLTHWANLGKLSNMLRNINLHVVVDSGQPVANISGDRKTLEITADENVTAEDISALIHHELKHLYQNSLSGGKAFGVDTNQYTKPHKAEDTREMYLKTRYEVDARFQQMLHSLRDKELPTNSSELFSRVLAEMDKYHLTDIFVSKKGRKKIQTPDGTIRAPMDNKMFRQYVARAMYILGD